MYKLLKIVPAFLLLVLIASPAFAQTGTSIGFSRYFGVGLTVIGAAYGIGRLANVALSSLGGFTLPSDVSASEKYYARDVVEPAVVAVEGVVQVPAATGLGHAVDRALIEANTVAQLSLGPEQE